MKVKLKVATIFNKTDTWNPKVDIKDVEVIDSSHSQIRYIEDTMSAPPPVSMKQNKCLEIKHTEFYNKNNIIVPDNYEVSLVCTF